MAYIGLSRVHSGLDDGAGAKGYHTMARDRAARASEAERRRIDIRERQLASLDSLTNPALFLAYKKAIDDALSDRMDDLELWLLRGNAEESNASGRGQRGTAGSVAFYEAILRAQPDHASAHHYLIHSDETIGRIDKELAHGEAYARLAPAIPHAAHMWGHDLRRVGRVNDAIAMFIRADSLERAYYRAEDLEPSLDWHHGHNLDLLASCYQHKGQMARAEERMRESGSLRLVDDYRAFNRREWPNFLIHRGRHAEALEAARVMAQTEYPGARTVGHALAGQALLALGRNDEAADELKAAQSALETVPLVAAGLIPRRSGVAPWVEGLRGELLLRTGNAKEAKPILEAVVRTMRSIPGPDAWSQTLFRLETMARSAREAGDWALAGHIADQMIDHDAAYGGSHVARALVLRHRNDAAGYRREMAEARRLWRDADPQLAELKGVPERGSVQTAKRRPE
jgi:tetratricopeptide (TPR) repeat protein